MKTSAHCRSRLAARFLNHHADLSGSRNHSGPRRTCPKTLSLNVNGELICVCGTQGVKRAIPAEVRTGTRFSEASSRIESLKAAMIDVSLHGAFSAKIAFPASMAVNLSDEVRNFSGRPRHPN